MATQTEKRFATVEATMRELDQKAEGLRHRICAHESRLKAIDSRQAHFTRSKATSELKVAEEREFERLTGECAGIRRELEFLRLEVAVVHEKRAPVAAEYASLSKTLEVESDQAELLRLTEIMNGKMELRRLAEIKLSEAFAAEHQARFAHETKRDAIQIKRNEEAREKHFASLPQPGQRKLGPIGLAPVAARV